MKKDATIILLVALLTLSASAQQVQRSFVSFEQYFHEVPAPAPHAVIPFSASAQNEYDVSVRVTTIDGTAVAGRDYVPIDTEIIFHAGSPTRIRDIEVQLIQNQNTADRTFTIKLQAGFPAGVSRTRGEIPVTITALPLLNIAGFQTNILLTWRASATNTALQLAKTLPGPWLTITNTPTKIPDTPNQTLSLPSTNHTAFFRLGAAQSP